MAIANIDDPSVLNGATVSGKDGSKLGKVDSVYFDNETDKPEWVAVKSGMFGSHVSLVPLQQGNWDGRGLTVPFDKAAIQNAPHHDPDTAISETDEADLYRHYGMDNAPTTPTPPPAAGRAAAGGQHSAPTDRDRSGDRDQIGDRDRAGGRGESTAGDDRRDRSGDAGIQGRDTSGPTTDGAMTRSEEQLRVGTEQREAGRARLRKHIVTENVSATVPVSHEEVTLEREPITEANRGDATAGSSLSEEEHEVTLTEERVVTSKETVPMERVRMGTKTVTEEQQVNDTVRKERIEAEGTEGVDAGGERSATGKQTPPAGTRGER